MYEDYCYFDFHRVGKGGTRYKWKRSHVSEVDNIREKLVGLESQHIYRTIQSFKNPEVTDGEPFISPLYFDLDFDEKLGQTLDDALNDARLILEYFLYLGAEDELGIWFSGNRGFHITLPFEKFGDKQPSTYLNKIWRGIAEGMAHKFELRTFDRSVYTKRRMWRMENTKHGKSGLWKIPLEIYELKTLDPSAIRKLAENPRISNGGNQ